jgi:hypothetical protein
VLTGLVSRPELFYPMKSLRMLAEGFKITVSCKDTREKAAPEIGHPSRQPHMVK